MACLDENTVDAYLEGKVSAERTRQVQLHVAECDRCRELLAVIVRTSAEAEGQVDPAAVARIHSLYKKEGRGVALLKRKGKWSGKTLGGRYLLGELLGRGGNGEVYEALQQNLGRQVAVKILLETPDMESSSLKRLELEARSAGSLNHPNIIQVTDFHRTAGGEPSFLVMEMLHGTNMRAAMSRDGQFSQRRTGFVARQILSALAAAHKAGIIHRDLKPENIYLTTVAGVHDVVKLLDFGLAKLTNKAKDEQSLTATGTILGTLHYMSPEQVRGNPVDHRTDIYSLGVVMYRALANAAPFDGPNEAAIIFAIAQKRPPPLTHHRDDLNEGFVEVVHRAMARKPSRRFPDAESMLEALESWDDHIAAISRDDPLGPQRTVVPVDLEPSVSPSRSILQAASAEISDSGSFPEVPEGPPPDPGPLSEVAEELSQPGVSPEERSNPVSGPITATPSVMVSDTMSRDPRFLDAVTDPEQSSIGFADTVLGARPEDLPRVGGAQGTAADMGFHDHATEVDVEAAGAGVEALVETAALARPPQLAPAAPRPPEGPQPPLDGIAMVGDGATDAPAAPPVVAVEAGAGNEPGGTVAMETGGALTPAVGGASPEGVAAPGPAEIPGPSRGRTGLGLWIMSSASMVLALSLLIYILVFRQDNPPASAPAGEAARAAGGDPAGQRSDGTTSTGSRTPPSRDRGGVSTGGHENPRPDAKVPSGPIKKAEHGTTGRPGSRVKRRRPAAGKLALGTTNEQGGRVWADVYLDGQRVGGTPLSMDKVKAGNHTVEVRRRGFKTLKKTVHIKPNRTYKAIWIMKK